MLLLVYISHRKYIKLFLTIYYRMKLKKIVKICVICLTVALQETVGHSVYLSVIQDIQPFMYPSKFSYQISHSRNLPMSELTTAR